MVYIRKLQSIISILSLEARRRRRDDQRRFDDRRGREETITARECPWM